MSFQNYVAHLTDGNRIAYTDSGPVKGSSTYTTLILIHGTGFNYHIFDKLHEIAPRYDLRTISLQRKGYKGSSEVTPTNLEDMKSRKGIDENTLLVGHFIQHIIHNTGSELPVPNETRTQGGVAVLGWSSGGVAALSVLSDSKVFPLELYEELERFLIKVVLYDPPHATFGFDLMEEGLLRLVTLKSTPQEFCDKLKTSVCCYYDHPTDWNGDPKQLDLRTHTERTSLDDNPQWEEIFESDVILTTSFKKPRKEMQPVVYELTQRALLDEEVIQRTFPKVGIFHIVCWKSDPNTLWAYHMVNNLYKEKKLSRPIKFFIASDANHFWHWDRPDEYLRAVTNGIQNK